MLQRLLPRPISARFLIRLVGGLAIVVVVLLAALIVPRFLGHYFWPIEKLYRSAPEQPVPFPHPVHVQQAGIDCVFCHRTVETERMASIPAVEQVLLLPQDRGAGGRRAGGAGGYRRR